MPGNPPAAPVRGIWPLAMVLVTAFQAFTFGPLLLKEHVPDLLYITFLCYIPAEWLFLTLVRVIMRQKDLLAECLALWLCGIGLAVCGSISAEYAWKQAVAVALGMMVYAGMLWLIADPERAMTVRPYVAFATMLLLALNLGIGLLKGMKNDNASSDQYNWIVLGGVSIQPSEIAKVAFIFVGAATLDRLQKAPSITRYMIFALGCIGTLVLLKDFGSVLLFFCVFLFLSVLRAADMRVLTLVTAAAVLGAAAVIYYRPYIANRFAAYRHVWEYKYDLGMQQARVLMYSSSGGLFGLGLGNGKLRGTYAASTDLVFGTIAEELGLVVAFLIPLCYIAIAGYAIRAARTPRSSFYSIAAISAAGLLLIQAALNVFGATDLLPFTGVTLPFVSRGGTSILSVWGLLAFVRACARDDPHIKDAPFIRKSKPTPPTPPQTTGEFVPVVGDVYFS